MSAVAADYDYQRVHLPADTDRETARTVLSLHAEYGAWELDRHRIWPDGRRQVLLRRRRTSGPQPPLAT